MSFDYEASFVNALPFSQRIVGLTSEYPTTA